MEGFLLHRVITTIKNKLHFKLRLSENQQDKSKRTSNKTNVKIVKQNSWNSATGKKIAKTSSPLLHSSVINGRKKNTRIQNVYKKFLNTTCSTDIV